MYRRIYLYEGYTTISESYTRTIKLILKNVSCFYFKIIFQFKIFFK